MTFTYAIVEETLARLLAVEPAGRGALRGRLKHLVKLGLASERPGKGQRVAYDRDTIDQWYLALMFERAKIDPVLAVRLARDNWDQPPGRKKRDPADAVTRGDATLRELVTVARAARRASDHYLVTIDFGGLTAIPTVGYTGIKGMPSLGHWLAESPDRLVMVFDLSARMHALDDTLDAVAAERGRGESEPTKLTG